MVISSLHDATFLIKWKQEETVLDVFTTMLDCSIESRAVIRYFRGEWLELARNSDGTLIRIFLPNISRTPTRWSNNSNAGQEVDSLKDFPSIKPRKPPVQAKEL